MEAETTKQAWTIASLLLPGLFTLTGTFLGAWLAFFFQNEKERKNIEKINIAAINQIQTILMQQLDALLILRRDFILPYIEAKKKFADNLLNSFAFPALSFRDYSYLKFNSGSLVFLADYGRAQLLMEIISIQTEFNEIMHLVNRRSDVHASRLQPKLEEIGYVEGELPPLPEKEFQEYLGISQLGLLKRYTDLIEILGIKAIDQHEKVIKRIHSAGKEIYPDAKAIITFKIK